MPWEWSAFASCGTYATKLPDGSVLVVGGRTLVTTDDGSGPVTAETVTNSAEVFDVNAGVWYPAASLSIARSGHTATAVADGHVVIAGGVGLDGAALDSFEVFDPELGVFSSPGLLSVARTEHAAAAAWRYEGPRGRRAQRKRGLEHGRRD